LSFQVEDSLTCSFAGFQSGPQDDGIKYAAIQLYLIMVPAGL
jgi:hypothetical protein